MMRAPGAAGMWAKVAKLGVTLASLVAGAVLASVELGSKIVAAPAAALPVPESNESDCASHNTIQIAGARIRLTLDKSAFALTPPQICSWVTRSAEAVGGYFGSFPV